MSEQKTYASTRQALNCLRQEGKCTLSLEEQQASWSQGNRGSKGHLHRILMSTVVVGFGGISTAAKSVDKATQKERTNGEAVGGRDRVDMG